MKPSLPPSKEKECDSCQITNLELHFIESPAFSNLNDLYVCDFCRETSAHNATMYPDQYEHGLLMRHICAVANILLRKLTEGK
jgi:hypothetical protein